LGISSLGIFSNGPVVAREEVKNPLSTDRHGAGKKGRTVFPRQQLFITSEKLDSLDFIKQVGMWKQF
jgi:hypothetical protein